MLEGYLLGALLSIIMGVGVVYFDSDQEDVHLDDAAIMILMVVLSWLGVVLYICAIGEQVIKYLSNNVDWSTTVVWKRPKK